jgi:hypothetical protein
MATDKREEDRGNVAERTGAGFAAFGSPRVPGLPEIPPSPSPVPPYPRPPRPAPAALPAAAGKSSALPSEMEVAYRHRQAKRAIMMRSKK